ncbi:MAG: T9SS type A sorting domain-containing protein [Deltaproteobacteria bacterium]
MLLNFQVKGQLPWGSIAPDFTLKQIPANCNPNGQWGPQYNLYSILNQGKNVVIDFSATWCVPCWNYHQAGIFENLWENHGTNGDNTTMVFFIESDCNTNVQCLCGNSGCSGVSTGNWTTGVNYPILSPSNTSNPPETYCNTITQAYDISFYPTFYAINAEHKTAWELYQPSEQEWESWLFESFPLHLDFNVITTECNTTIDLSTTGGKGQLKYNWSTGAPTQDISGLLNGNYSVTVTDENGYFLIKQVTINADYNNCCLPNMNVDLSSPGNHTTAEMLQAMGLNSLEELCNGDKVYNIKLNGNLILDSENSGPVCFNWVNIAMMKDAKISVINKTELQLNNTDIFGCFTMWDKIYVESGSKILVNNNTKIADAKNGIYADKGSKIESYYSTFYNNSVGIYLSYSGNGDKTDIILENCVFTADDLYNDFGTQNNNTAPTPQRPIAGIYINGQNNVNLRTYSGKENTFSHLSNGILCYHGSVTVGSAIFNDIHPTISFAWVGIGGPGEDDVYNSNDFLLWQDGYAVKIINCLYKSKIWQCKFTDVGCATGCSNGELEFSSNKKSFDVGTAVIGFNIKNVNISFNSEFEVHSKGVFLNNCSGGKISGISDNYKQKFTFSDINISTSTGIELQNCSDIDISLNEISNCVTGIFLQNSNENTLNINKIIPGTNIKSNGIVLANSNGNILEENNLRCNYKNYDGIKISDSFGGTYSCNNTYNFNNGIHFTGSCGRSLVEGNIFSSNFKDLVLGLPDALNTTAGMTDIGQQGNWIYPQKGWGNKWYSNSSTAHHSGTFDIIQMSKFLVNATVFPIYKPVFVEAEGEWFQDNNTVTNLEPCSSGHIIAEPDCRSIITKILMVDTMRGINPCARVKWQYNYLKQLIEMKKKGLLSQECEDFLKRHNYYTLLQVVRISKAIDSINYVKITIDSTQINDQFRERLIRAVDSIRLLIDNTVLVDSCLKVINVVNRVRLNQIVNDTLTDSDITILQPIAQSCPDEMGKGVYWARGLLSMYQDKIYPTFEECVSPVIIPRSETKTQSEAEKLIIVPNPASDYVNIIVNLQKEEKGKLELLDLHGNIIYNKSIDTMSNEFKIDTQSFPDGIYIVRYSTSTGDEKIRKLIITK